MKRIYSDRFDSEEHCKNVFHDFLKSKHPKIKLKWIKHPNGPNEPPDFSLAIDKKCYSVEVTATKVLIKARGNKIEEGTFFKSREAFVDELDKESNELNILNGYYGVFFLVPWTIPLTVNLKIKVKAEVMDYINKTKD